MFATPDPMCTLLSLHCMGICEDDIQTCPRKEALSIQKYEVAHRGRTFKNLMIQLYFMRQNFYRVMKSEI